MKQCPKCKRNYSRDYCEFCKRQERWENKVKKLKIKSHFPDSRRIQSFLLSNDLPDNLDRESAYLYGPVHSGKTIRAAQMLLQFEKEKYVEGYKVFTAYIPVVELFFKIKKTYEKQDQSSEFQLVDYYSKAVDFLLLDDIGPEYSTDWAMNILYLIINRRYEMMKTTVITSNLSINKLAERANDDRIPSRIRAMCQLIEMKKQYL
jgi:DNA replication protein DnaC